MTTTAHSPADVAPTAAQDTAEEVGGEILVDLYHRTSPECADSIMAERRFRDPDLDPDLEPDDLNEDADAADFDSVTYFARTQDMLGYGSAVIHVRVPEHLVQEDEDQSFWDDGTEVDDEDKHWFITNHELKPEHIVGRYDDEGPIS